MPASRNRCELNGERTFGVCDLTLPARAREPWTLPMIADLNSNVSCSFGKLCGWMLMTIVGLLRVS